jgi:hypothetical protein
MSSSCFVPYKKDALDIPAHYMRFVIWQPRSVVLSRHFTFSFLQQRNWPTQYSKNIAYSRAKIKKMFASRTRPTVTKRCDSKYFLVWFVTILFFWLPEVLILFQNFVRNWFTHLNEQNPLLDFEGIRFVNERSLFWREKIPLPTDP